MTKTTRRLINTALLATLLTAGLPAAAQTRTPGHDDPTARLEAPGSWTFFLEIVRPLVGYWLGVATTGAPANDDALRAAVIGPRSSVDRSPTMDPDG